jgi:hypothetical protein
MKALAYIITAAAIALYYGGLIFVLEAINPIIGG